MTCNFVCAMSLLLAVLMLLFVYRDPSKLHQFLSMNQNVIGDDDTRDCFVWNQYLDGVYSAKARYRWMLDMLANPISVAQSWLDFWNFSVPENRRVFAWQAAQNAVPTMAVLARHHLSVSDVCRRCNVAQETLMHCVRDCPLKERVWRAIGFSLPSQFFSPIDFYTWIRMFSRRGLVMVLATTWTI